MGGLGRRAVGAGPAGAAPEGKGEAANELAARLAPRGVPMWWPWARGERVPWYDPALSITLRGADISHGPDALLRGAYEATGFVARYLVERAQSCGTPARRFVVSGGGAATATGSRPWPMCWAGLFRPWPCPRAPPWARPSWPAWRWAGRARSTTPVGGPHGPAPSNLGRGGQPPPTSATRAGARVCRASRLVDAARCPQDAERVGRGADLSRAQVHHGALGQEPRHVDGDLEGGSAMGREVKPVDLAEVDEAEEHDPPVGAEGDNVVALVAGAMDVQEPAEGQGQGPRENDPVAGRVWVTRNAQLPSASCHR